MISEITSNLAGIDLCQIDLDSFWLGPCTESCRDWLASAFVLLLQEKTP